MCLPWAQGTFAPRRWPSAPQWTAQPLPRARMRSAFPCDPPAILLTRLVCRGADGAPTRNASIRRTACCAEILAPATRAPEGAQLAIERNWPPAPRAVPLSALDIVPVLFYIAPGLRIGPPCGAQSRVAHVVV